MLSSDIEMCLKLLHPALTQAPIMSRKTFGGCGFGPDPEWGGGSYHPYTPCHLGGWEEEGEQMKRGK